MRTVEEAMHRLRGLLRRIDDLVRRRRFEQQVSDEMAFHLSMEAERNVRQGLDAATAARKARVAFGGQDKHTEAMRSGRGMDFIEQIGRDITYAYRSLRKTPAFSLGVICTLVLGIGFNTFVFSVANSFLLHPLNVFEPERLVRVSTSESSPAADGTPQFGSSSYPDFTDMSSAPGVLEAVIAYMPASYMSTWRGGQVPAQGQFVSENYFEVLGVEPARGRFFDPNDDSPVVVLGYSLWQREFGKQPHVVGEKLTINNEPFTIIGVAPRGFAGTDMKFASDVFLPFTQHARLRPGDMTLRDRAARSLTIMGRLERGATTQAAESALQPLMADLGGLFPATNRGRTVQVRPAGTLLSDPAERQIVMRIAAGILLVTFLVLAIGCLNIASLMLARALSRRRETAIRLSLGASRRRVVTQFLVESEVLAVTSGLVALAVLALLPGLLAGTRLGSRAPFEVDARVMTFSLILSAVTGIFFGLAPAVRMTRRSIGNALQEGQSSLESTRLTNFLVTAQLTLSLVLLVVAASVIESVKAQQNTDPGFATEGLVVLTPTVMLSSERAGAAFSRELSQRMRGVAGVEAVAIATNVPLASEGYRTTASVPRSGDDPPLELEIAANHVGPDYFRTLGIPLIRGREIDAAAPPTAKGMVITRSMAQRWWPGRDPIGDFVRVGGSDGEPYPIIAVAADVRFRSLNEAPRPMMFIQGLEQAGSSIHVRTSGDPSATVAAMRREGDAIDPNIMLYRVQSMGDVLRDALAVQSMVGMGLTAFACLAAVLASIGLYGLLVFGVLQRKLELGVRMALGATSRVLQLTVLRRAGRIIAAGTAAGLCVSVAAAALITQLAPGVFRITLSVFVLSAFLLAVVAVVASLTSTRAVTRINPMLVMRNG